MPEIAEVARVVHYLKKHLVGKKIINTLVQEDDIIYGKVGTSASAFKKAMDGKTIIDARQQGKYFWLVADSPPHPVMHLGMTGWVKFSNDDSGAYRSSKKEDTEWPPRFWKFIFQTDAKGDDKCEVAFVDARRLGRIRLVDAEGDQIRKTSPLKENGPDPVIDKDILTVEWLATKMRSKKVPIKALLLDQANISGVGNWVADEVLYQAKIHPEQYSNSFSDNQIGELHDALIDVCTTACNVLADSDQFPSTWIMKHRWNKGKKDSNVLPNGEKITHITVGGRTSAVVLSRQKKTGAVPDAVAKVEAEAGEDDVPTSPAKPKGTKRKAAKEDPRPEEDATPPKKARGTKMKPKEEEIKEELDVMPPKKGAGTKRKSNGVKIEAEQAPEAEKKRPRRSGGNANGTAPEVAADSGAEVEVTSKKEAKAKQTLNKSRSQTEESSGRRRSARLK
ncbi:formamidopyrimidine-DNA glycosylase [Myriangium duriaei CBS 260.36]|uniref:Formamidopyrimidine-DNA glycosylase n=1 Tax=Myriangium duriaei CBS 260.36 TaxID=1168546 RepID=A0A9P4IWK2_9PEZI|nr:formamidopyrimidine-DNA glycosylase [Myriangium duriaei CBS 260.36]